MRKDQNGISRHRRTSRWQRQTMVVGVEVLKKILIFVCVLWITQASWGSSLPEATAPTVQNDIQDDDLSDEKMSENFLSLTGSESSKSVDKKNEIKSESDIPVLTQLNDHSKEGTPFASRVLISIGILGLMVLGLIFLSRFVNHKKMKPNLHEQIKVVTRFPLGSKKNLAIIRVAGESILIGITEHNINLIKSLSLIDEELPSEVPEKFAAELSQAQIQDKTSFSAQKLLVQNSDKILDKKNTSAEVDEFSFGSVKDMIVSRLKEMRTL